MNIMEHKHYKRARILNKRKTGYYVWKTKGDGRVRSRHASLNGKVFNWQDIPPGGKHPGEDFNCRCKAVPIDDTDAYERLGQPQEVESINNSVEIEFAEEGRVNPRNLEEMFEEMVRDALDGEVPVSLTRRVGRWKPIDFVMHFYYGFAKPVTVNEIGHMAAIQARVIELGVLDRFKEKIRAEATSIDRGNLTVDFKEAHSFLEVDFSHGNSTVFVKFIGYVDNSTGEKLFTGFSKFRFFDIFSDPLNFIQNEYGNSNTEEISWLKRRIYNLNGAPYEITGEWEIPIVGNVD